MKIPISWHVLLLLTLIFSACKQSGKDSIEIPLVYKWERATSEISDHKKSKFFERLSDTTGKTSDNQFFFRIVSELEIYKDSVLITVLDTGMDIDVGYRDVYHGKVVGNKIRGKSEINGKYVQIDIDSLKKKAVVSIVFVQIQWDSLAPSGGRSVMNEIISLKGSESDSVVEEEIRKKVYRMGLWDQYSQNIPRPEIGSPLRWIYPAVVKRYKSELMLDTKK